MTTTLLATLIGLGAALLLLAAGYLLGIGRDRSARDAIRRELEERKRRDQQADGTLQGAVRELLGPLVRREQVGYELAHLELGTGQRGELPRLLDDIARTGGLSAVILSDQDGLPLAASRGAEDLDRLAGHCSLVMVVADRLSRDSGPSPLAIMVHDDSNRLLLSRLFDVAGQKLLLTGVTGGTHLAPTALDPALAKLETVLGQVDPARPTRTQV